MTNFLGWFSLFFFIFMVCIDTIVVLESVIHDEEVGRGMSAGLLLASWVSFFLALIFG